MKPRKVEIIDRALMLNFPTELISNPIFKKYGDHLACELIKFNEFDDPGSLQEFKYSIKFAYEVPRFMNEIYVNNPQVTLYLKIYTVLGYKENKLTAASVYTFPMEQATTTKIHSVDEFFNLPNNKLAQGGVVVPIFNDSNIIYDVIDEIHCNMLL